MLPYKAAVYVGSMQQDVSKGFGEGLMNLTQKVLNSYSTETCWSYDNVQL